MLAAPLYLNIVYILPCYLKRDCVVSFNLYVQFIFFVLEGPILGNSIWTIIINTIFLITLRVMLTFWYNNLECFSYILSIDTWTDIDHLLNLYGCSGVCSIFSFDGKNVNYININDSCHWNYWSETKRNVTLIIKKKYILIVYQIFNVIFLNFWRKAIKYMIGYAIRNNWKKWCM